MKHTVKREEEENEGNRWEGNEAEGTRAEDSCNRTAEMETKHGRKSAEEAYQSQ